MKIQEDSTHESEESKNWEERPLRERTINHESSGESSVGIYTKASAMDAYRCGLTLAASREGKKG